jgi:alcohol dehydrogenase, propanol-preferring
MSGMTCFNSLRNAHIIAPAIVAVHGIGGLGHLAIQFAAKLGCTVVAISTTAEKYQLTKDLGAAYYIDSSKENPVEVLTKLGGAKAILGTVYDSKATSALVPALAVDGVLLILGLDPFTPLAVPAAALVSRRSSVKGWASGMPMDGEDTVNFAAEKGVKVIVQKFPLSKVQEAYDLMISGKAKFRAVLTPGKK